MTAPMATALPMKKLVLLTDAPLLNGEGLGGGTGVPLGEPKPAVPALEPAGTVPDATTRTEEPVVGKGAALVLYTTLAALETGRVVERRGVDDGAEEEEDGAVERTMALVVGIKMREV